LLWVVPEYILHNVFGLYQVVRVTVVVVIGNSIT